MEESRGQIILVAALAIAVTFVALALIVNTVIFTENLATRETVSGKEAVMFQENVADSGEQLLLRANRYNNSSYENLSNTYRRDIGVLSESENLHAVTQGGLRDIGVVDIRNGTKIKQSTIQHVNDSNDNPTWTAAEDVHQTRQFRMVIDDIDATQFTVNVSDGSSWWRIRVEDSGGLSVQIANATDTSIGTCTDSTNPYTIGLTNGSVGGSTCSPLQFGQGVSAPYDITFENGTNITASYQLIVDRDTTTVDSTGSYTAGNEPLLYPAIFNSTLDFTFERSDLTYSSNVTVQPAG